MANDSGRDRDDGFPYGNVSGDPRRTKADGDYRAQGVAGMGSVAPGGAYVGGGQYGQGHDSRGGATPMGGSGHGGHGLYGGNYSEGDFGRDQLSGFGGRHSGAGSDLASGGQGDGGGRTG